MSAQPLSRFVSVANATNLLRALPKRSFASSSFSTRFFAHNNQLSRGPSKIHQNLCANGKTLPKFFSTSSSRPASLFTHSTSPLTGANKSSSFARAAPSARPFPHLQGQAVRGFSRKAWRGDHDASAAGAAGRGFSRKDWHAEHEVMNQQVRRFWRGCGHGHHYHHHMRRRRPMRFVFRMMVLSLPLIAVPAIVFMDAPTSTLVKVPLMVGGVLGGAYLLTRSFLFILPVVAVGGAITFWVFSMPAATTLKDLNQVLKRETKGRYSSAMSTLGPDWQVESSKNDEWFRWTFPTPTADGKRVLDKVDIRMAVFDPNDRSHGKERAFKLLDKLEADGDFKDRKRCGSHTVENLIVKHENNHLWIQFEEDGAKMMDQKMAQKYLALGQIVDRAATEMEARQPGLKLGDQVVLVHQKRGDSSWGSWSPYGDLAVRIPFSRSWVRDVSGA